MVSAPFGRFRSENLGSVLKLNGVCNAWAVVIGQCGFNIGILWLCLRLGGGDRICLVLA